MICVEPLGVEFHLFAGVVTVRSVVTIDDTGCLLGVVGFVHGLVMLCLEMRFIYIWCQLAPAPVSLSKIEIRRILAVQWTDLMYVPSEDLTCTRGYLVEYFRTGTKSRVSQ